jgi:hypothetical protein
MNISMQRHHLLSGLAAAGVLALALTGCTGPEPEPTPSASATGEAEAPETFTDITDNPGNEDGMTGALADSTTETCELVDGSWSVAGTVVNPTEETVSYRIFMSLLDEDGATVALAQVNADGVEPGAEAEWSRTIDVDAENLSCVPRVERRAA